MTLVNAYLPIITLYVNGLSSLIKRHRLADWVNKTRPDYMLPTQYSLQLQGHTEAQSEEMEKDMT